MFDEHAEEAIRAEEHLKMLARGRAEGEAKGIAQERARTAARDKKIADYLRSIGVSPERIEAVLAIK